MTTPEHKQKLREEWYKTDICKMYKPFQDICADFWLSIIDRELEKQREENTNKLIRLVQVPGIERE